MPRIVCLGLIAALAACKPTIILEDPEPTPRPSDPADDPLVEHEAIRESVRTYVAALAQRDIEAASAQVVRETFTLHEDLRVAALQATRAQLESLDLLQVFMILQIRAELRRSELEALDGRGLFGWTVGAGLVGEGLESVSLDEVWLDEAGTTAQIQIGGEPVVCLRKSDDDGELRWRVDVPEMFRLHAPAIEAMAREQIDELGKARTAYALLEVGTAKYLDVAILEGPIDGATGSAP